MPDDVPPYYVTNTAQVEIRYFLQNNNAANIFHVGYTSEPSSAELTALCGAVADWLTTDWKPASSQDWTANEILATDLGGPTGKRVSFPLSPVIQGDGTDQAMPANVTIAVKADTGIRGRGRSGRWFWVGLGEASVDGNEITSTVHTGLLLALNTLNTNIAALDNFTGMVVPNSFKTTAHVQHHLNPATSYAIEEFTLTDDNIDSQKDRLPFHKKKKKSIVTHA
jgi:hypothetical protein